MSDVTRHAAPQTLSGEGRDAPAGTRTRVIWTPPEGAWEASRFGDFARWLDERGRAGARDYESLRRWSLEEPALF